MSTDTPSPRVMIDVAAWLDDASRDALDLLVASVAEMAGFQVAAVSIVRDDQMVTVSAAGDDGAAETLLGMAAPREAVQRELAAGEDWGRFRFVSHDLAVNDLDDWSWIPDMVRQEGPDAWDPEDFCLAPLHDDDGMLIGLLSIDVPLTGRRPSASQRTLLDRYARQCERAVRMALERSALAERVRLSDAARRVVRRSTSQRDLAQVLDDCREPIIEGYRTDFLAIRTIESGEVPRLGTGSTGPVSRPELVELVSRLARLAWDRQETLLLVEGHDDDLVPAEDRRVLLDAAHERDLGAGLIVPMGAGSTWLGYLIFGRKDPSLVWNAYERSSAIDVARDIGQAVLAGIARNREQRLLDELRRLSTYKSELLSTVSHELKNPLGAITGHLELLEGAEELGEDAQYSLGAMGRATRRISRVVDALLLLSRYDDPDVTVESVPVALGPLIDGALEMLRFAAQQRNLAVRVELPEHPVSALGDPDELDRVLTNLLSNAVKYTPRDRGVTISVVEHASEVELAVSDEGMGISRSDQDRLFDEFFRSTNPRALAQPGTGLGLAICARIVARHGGRIEVESELGAGSTFRVFLPAPDPDGD